MESAPASPIIAGRACGTCTLCCKVLKIDELAKPQGTWCPKCAVGKGCRIYPDHPSECKTFYCGYLTVDDLGRAWWPARSNIVLVSELEGKRIAAHVDPGHPTVWRKEPYYSQLKQWAWDAARGQGQVVVCILNRAIVILPDDDVDLGPIGPDERIVTRETRTPAGIKFEALKLHRDDPRLSGTPMAAPSVQQ